MKFKSIVVLSVLAAVLFAAVFGVGRASATTGCFNDTNGHWAETFICWMKDNGITSGVGGGNYSPEGYVTRAQMAVFMKASADVPPSIGDIYINSGSSGWVSESNLGHVYYAPNYARLITSSGTDVYYLLSPDLPSSLYNKETHVKGVKLCYNATTGASISSVFLTHYDGTGAMVTGVFDSTSRSDKTCRVYLITNPNSFWGGDQVALEVVFHSPSAGVEYWVDIYSATFILSPTANTANLLIPPSAAEARPTLEAPEALP